MTRRCLHVLILLATIVASPIGGASAATPGAATLRVPVLHWLPCEHGFECTTARVPLDYDDPGGPQIRLALLRLPASDRSARLGSLFVNPGGPGGSGVDIVRDAGPVFPPEILERYDLVGVDPRGIARSTPLLCFESQEQLGEVVPPFPYPVSHKEIELQRQLDLALADACAQRGGPLLDHMSPANVARDFDLLRAAVGDDNLNYLGVSYGSYLGATYANLFPDRVGAFVVDGVLDPIAWSTGRGDAATVPFSARLGSARGAMKTLREFFRLCDEAGPACSFSGDSEARYAALAQRLTTHSVLTTDPEGNEVEVTYPVLIAMTLDALYEPLSWPAFAGFLAAVEHGDRPLEAGARMQEMLRAAGVSGDPEDYTQTVEGGLAVECADSDNPSSFDAWPTAARESEARDGYFGAIWTWLSSPCAVWPGSDHDRYMGPWTAATANPVMVIGNLSDPATPYEGAVTLSGLLPNSRLLTYEGPGHAAVPRFSPCIMATVTAYFVAGDLPAEGASCPANPSPFLLGPPPGPPPMPVVHIAHGPG